eukprot:scaffold15.g4264.t1
MGKKAAAGKKAAKAAEPKKGGKKKAAAGEGGPATKKQKAAEAKAAKQAAEAAAEEEQEAVSLKGTFAKDLAVMMYGFGDDPEPLPETVDLVEDCVIEYATGLMQRAMDSAAARGRLKGGPQRGASVGPEDILFLVRKEPKKYGRVKELLILAEELKDARRMVDVQVTGRGRVAMGVRSGVGIACAHPGVRGHGAVKSALWLFTADAEIAAPCMARTQAEALAVPPEEAERVLPERDGDAENVPESGENRPEGGA